MDNQGLLLQKMEEVKENSLHWHDHEGSEKDPFIAFRDQFLTDRECVVNTENEGIIVEFIWRKVDPSQKNVTESLLEIIPQSKDDVFVDDNSQLKFRREIEETETHLIVRATLVQDSVNNQK